MTQQNEVSEVPVVCSPEDLVSLKEFCETHGLPYGRTRKLAIAKELPSTVAPRYILHTWSIDPNAVVTLPDTKARAAARSDGRQRYHVFATKDELAQIMAVVGPAQIEDPRVKAKARRDAKAKAEADANDAVVVNAEGEVVELPTPGPINAELTVEGISV